ncbi:MAG TPA: hypothetical protein VGS16_15210 [Candidatus Dormibacteraeota bacterium]|nr:hypothetical protein [Candidatus Dormibacteraeota bacterium]
MSDNMKFYETKMAELKRARTVSRPLNGQFEELMLFVQECEARWSTTNRTDRTIDSGEQLS